MAVTYKASMKKAELLEIAVKNGVAVEDSMTKEQIIAALDAQSGTDAAETTGASNDTTPEEAATQDAQSGAGADEATGESNDTTPEESAAEETQSDTDGHTMFVYAGPSLPRGRLKENAVFRGTFADVTAYLADVLEEYPQAAKLIVPAEKLGAFSVKAKTPGNIAHKYYNDIVLQMRNGKEE